MKKKEELKSKIIVSAIEYIEKDGMHGLTIRKVAEIANVNIAAINYYFGSKDELVEEVLKYTQEHYQRDMEDFLARDYPSSRELLHEIAVYNLSGGMLYQNITKAHLYAAFINNNYDSPFMVFFRDYLHKLLKRLREFNENRDYESIILQIISSVMFIPIFPGVFEGLGNIELKNNDYQMKYINNLLDNVFCTNHSKGEKNE
ncbi:MAG: TetR/AcrR family transcriptional regulator [Candidatus Coatesbacteria bacterium]|nr:TetR/AcrR family transcriptional regulator [Candidatus Coatesbacteria bacterium]